MPALIGAQHDEWPRFLRENRNRIIITIQSICRIIGNEEKRKRNSHQLLIIILRTNMNGWLPLKRATAKTSGKRNDWFPVSEAIRHCEKLYAGCELTFSHNIIKCIRVDFKKKHTNLIMCDNYLHPLSLNYLRILFLSIILIASIWIWETLPSRVRMDLCYCACSSDGSLSPRIRGSFVANYPLWLANFVGYLPVAVIFCAGHNIGERIVVYTKNETDGAFSKRVDRIATSEAKLMW